MKKSIPALAFLCMAVYILAACSTSQNTVNQPLPDTDKGNLGTSSCYVIRTDGSTQYYSTLKLVTGVFTTPHLVADGKTVIQAKEVMAYQDGKRYAVSQKLLTTSKASYVADETLPGFAVRVARGKLNIYSRKYYNGNTSKTEYFLQAGDEGEIIAYSPEAMKELIKDNNAALDYFNSKTRISPKSRKMMVTADMYNNPAQYISKN
jgi:hypothetical protein